MVVPANFRSLNRIQFTPERYRAIKRFLETGEEPPHITSRNGKSHFRRTARKFSISPEDPDQLVFNDTEHRPPRRLSVIRKDKVNDFLQQQWKDAGFRGREVLYDKAKNKVIGVTGDAIREFLKNQEVQQLNKMTTKPSNAPIVQPLRPSEPFQHWQMDLMDLESLSGQNDRHRWLLVVIDIFSKFLYLRPMTNKRTGTIVGKMQEIFLTGDVPRILQSDNGSEFISNEMRDLCQQWNVEQRFGRPFKPTSQGAVERANGTVKRMLRAGNLYYGDQRWLDRIQRISYDYNTSKHRITGYIPYQVHRSHVPHALFMSIGPPRPAPAGQTEQQATETFMERQGREARTRNNKVRRRINRFADEMIEKSKALEPALQVGDTVRRDLGRGRPAEKVNRKWSKQLYRVSEIGQREGEVGRHYRIRKVTGSPAPLTGTYHRYQLQRVDPQKLCRPPRPERRTRSPVRTPRRISRQERREAEDVAEEGRAIIAMLERQPEARRRERRTS